MSEEWYVYKNQAQQGPYTWTQLYQETQAGRILPEDLVWNKALANWVPASQVSGLCPGSRRRPRVACSVYCSLDRLPWAERVYGISFLFLQQGPNSL